MNSHLPFPSISELSSIGMWVDMCFDVNDASKREFTCQSIEPQNDCLIVPEIMHHWQDNSFTSRSSEYLEQIFYQLVVSSLEDHPSPIKFFHRIGDQIWSLHKYSIFNNAIHFRFTIVKNPFVQKEIQTNKKGTNHFLEELKGLKILVVDDNQISVLITKKFLETSGVEVTCAYNGSMAIELCRNNSYDLILMDIHMPQLNGFQTAECIRNSSINQFAPIIAFTTSSYYEVKDELFESGMNEYIQKPFKAEELQSKIFMLVGATRKAV